MEYYNGSKGGLYNDRIWWPQLRISYELLELFERTKSHGEMKSLELARSKCTFRTFSSPFCLTKSLSFCTNDLQYLRSYSTKVQSTKIRWQSGPSTDLLMKSILSPAREYHLSTARLDYMHWTLLGKSSCRSAFLIHLSEYVAGLLTRLWIVQCLGRPIIVHQLHTL